VSQSNGVVEFPVNSCSPHLRSLKRTNKFNGRKSLIIKTDHRTIDYRIVDNDCYN